jgi:hypothetical protein
MTLLTISHQITFLDNSFFILPATHFSILHCPFFPSPTLNHSLGSELMCFLLWQMILDGWSCFNWKTKHVFQWSSHGYLSIQYVSHHVLLIFTTDQL